MKNLFKPYYLTLRGELVKIDRPLIMGILNVTPDSFYADSRCFSTDKIEERVKQIIAEGGDIIDIGAYSTRPGADDISADEEYSRLKVGLEIIKSIAPDVYVSVDTFRADVAERCVNDFGVDIINDVSGGIIDNNMFATMGRLKVPYILMHMRGTPATMQSLTDYDCVTADVIKDLAEKIERLQLAGVNDIIVDPGFGFSKTLEQNYELMAHLEEFHHLNLPLLVGISRKSMIFRLLDTTPAESLNGTTVLNTIALMQGAHIIRVHDVKPAVETARMVAITTKYSNI